MQTLVSPATPEEAQINRNKMDLQDSIQKAFNRIQYDRKLTDRERHNLELRMHIMEMDYFNFFGEEVSNG